MPAISAISNYVLRRCFKTVFITTILQTDGNISLATQPLGVVQILCTLELGGGCSEKHYGLPQWEGGVCGGRGTFFFVFLIAFIYPTIWENYQF